MNGRFIVLEGPDGSGTTTHAQILANRLKEQAHHPFLTHEPTDGPIGRFIRGQLGELTVDPLTLQLLFTADRAWHVHHELLPALDAGKTVICDRYSLSTLVYADALGIDSSPLLSLNKIFVQPTVQIVLLPPFSVCEMRVGKRLQKDILEEHFLQRRVYDGYQRMAQQEHLTVIDSSLSKEGVANAIWRAAGF